jgi:hypothetical protein
MTVAEIARAVGRTARADGGAPAARRMATRVLPWRRAMGNDLIAERLSTPTHSSSDTGESA